MNDGHASAQHWTLNDSHASAPRCCLKGGCICAFCHFLNIGHAFAPYYSLTIWHTWSPHCSLDVRHAWSSWHFMEDPRPWDPHHSLAKRYDVTCSCSLDIGHYFVPCCSLVVLWRVSMPEPHTILWMLSIFGHSLVDPAPHDLCHSLDACMCKRICLLHVILLCRKFCLGHRHCPPLTFLAPKTTYSRAGQSLSSTAYHCCAWWAPVYH